MSGPAANARGFTAYRSRVPKMASSWKVWLSQIAFKIRANVPDVRNPHGCVVAACRVVDLGSVRRSGAPGITGKHLLHVIMIATV